MDIQYLLWLQDFRNSINDSWTPFMEWVSMFAVTFMIMFPVFWYWCVNKKGGLYTITSYMFCMLLTPVIKLTACVYRPWIRDARIVPAGDAITTATGYSFPSGHTTTAAPLAGGMAVVTWKNKKTRVLSVLFVLFILLTGFSRNYLGVHTPQDVFVAITISILSLILTAKLFQYLEKHPEKENMFLLIGLLVCVAALFYFWFKSYPMDYNAEGKLIVDPQKMMIDGFGDVGKVIGFIIARFVEKNWIRFRSAGFTVKGVIVCAVGLVPMYFMKSLLSPVIQELLGKHFGKMTFNILYVFYFIALFPLILKLLDKWLHKGAAQAADKIA